MDPAHSIPGETTSDAAGISTSAVDIGGAAIESSRFVKHKVYSYESLLLY